ncbi:MAG: helix-turn-helix transcriptional regulator [Alistipes sp.]|nr:helix-turn-helix transcriptional regulator [Alistipes sp.]
MREKLLKLMDSEKLTASRLAELLGIRSSGISHILSERNKPSYDLLQKILRRFPNINPDWLLLDSDQMYRTPNASSVTSNEVNNINETLLFDEAVVDEQKEPASVPAEYPALGNELSQRAMSHRGIKRIIVLYNDLTFESYDAK